jgi:hypothetical protein
VIPWTKKINVIWWFGNEFDPIENEPQMWPTLPLWQRRILWALRNPMENFNRYVIGILDRDPVVVGESTPLLGSFAVSGGWAYYRIKPRTAKWAWRPGLSYEGGNGNLQLFVGWKHDGPFGAALRRSNGYITPSTQGVVTMWNVVNAVLSGGFLKGYKTYLAGVGLIVVGVSKYLSGDETLSQFVTGGDLLTILGGLGFVGVKSALAAHAADVSAVLNAVTAFSASQTPPAK